MYGLLNKITDEFIGTIFRSCMEANIRAQMEGLDFRNFSVIPLRLIEKKEDNIAMVRPGVWEQTTVSLYTVDFEKCRVNRIDLPAKIWGTSFQVRDYGDDKSAADLPDLPGKTGQPS